MADEPKACFVISPIGEPDSETRSRADKVLKYVIRPAVEECGYSATRADQIAEPGMIASQVIQRVIEDPLVVADLTSHNPNVFYELALRHALRRPLVQIMEKGERVPFDVAGSRLIFLDHKDLDIVDEARRGMIEQIRAMEKKGGAVETPISTSLDLAQLQRSTDVEERSLAEVVSSINELQRHVRSIASDMHQVQRLAFEAPRQLLVEIADRIRAMEARVGHILEREDREEIAWASRYLAGDVTAMSPEEERAEWRRKQAERIAKGKPAD